MGGMQGMQPQMNQQFNPMAMGGMQGMQMGGMSGMQMPMGMPNNQAAFGPMVPPNFQNEFNGRQ